MIKILRKLGLNLETKGNTIQKLYKNSKKRPVAVS